MTDIQAARSMKRDYPLLWEKAEQYDFTERLCGCTDPLLAEIDKALREIFDARRYVAEEASRRG